MIKGSCLCGNVQIEINGKLGEADACHCTQCRKQSGHYWASASVKRDQLNVAGAEQVRWYAASPQARRGFCGTCGSFLFWDADNEQEVAVALGIIDSPTGVKLEKHIFVADKGDYYDIADGLPQNPQ